MYSLAIFASNIINLKNILAFIDGFGKIALMDLAHFY